MNCSACAIQMLVFAGLSSCSALASAGTMGPTSRGTVSISITIPPHLLVRPSKPAGVRSSALPARGLCISSNGFEQYHVALLGPGASRQELANAPESEAIMGQARLGAFCSWNAAPEQIGPNAVDRFVAASPTSGLVTLLIVPD